jgi:outer membrane protein OmpA-like peptidoglycan-associated protein
VIRAATTLFAALLAGGCASDRVTLLDNEPGNATGAVAVIAPDGRESVIDRPLTQAALRNGLAKPKAIKAIKPSYAELLADLPPRAKAFVITFPIGQSRIPLGQRSVLEAIRNESAIRPGAQIEVAGFTDSSGSDTLNDKISLDRAAAVAAELREYGFPVAPGDAIGRGEDEAKARLGDDKMDESYRRVEVIVR